MSYKKALAKLKKLPVKERLLATGVYKYFEINAAEEPIASCGCAVGKILPNFYKELTYGSNIIGSSIRTINDLRRYRRHNGIFKLFKNDIKELEITIAELTCLQSANDNTPSTNINSNSLLHRKLRYGYIISWLEARIKEEELKNISSDM
jgi:hypothetical protein